MSSLEKTVLIVIPKSQFCEQELFGVLEVFKSAAVRTIVLSRSGQEARGMDKNRFQPDGMLVDWDKQEGVPKWYPAIVLIGGKGARKSLWDDPILPQILTDHFRAGKVIGALGSSIVVLAKAGLLNGDAARPEDDAACEALQALNVSFSDHPVEAFETFVTGAGGQVSQEFARKVVNLLL